jgi:hypothetical protein
LLTKTSGGEISRPLYKPSLPRRRARSLRPVALAASPCTVRGPADILLVLSLRSYHNSAKFLTVQFISTLIFMVQLLLLL